MFRIGAPIGQSQGIAVAKWIGRYLWGSQMSVDDLTVSRVLSLSVRPTRRQEPTPPGVNMKIALASWHRDARLYPHGHREIISGVRQGSGWRGKKGPAKGHTHPRLYERWNSRFRDLITEVI
jgi:hypothetical protein